MEQGENAPCGRTNRHLFFGLALIVFGALMLVERLSPVEFDSGWPFFLIVFGIWKLIDPPPSGRVLRSRRFGVWLLFIGCWGLANSVHLFGLYYDTSWPLLVVGAVDAREIV
jgi:uncharacterized membrane protein HdeD (DUF308 family)